jgi:hypothetical protein
MSRRITRRAAARLLLSGPAALAIPDLLVGKTAPKASAKPALSAAERRQLDKSVAQLREMAGKLRKVAVPLGSEPAFAFQPILPRK